MIICHFKYSWEKGWFAREWAYEEGGNFSLVFLSGTHSLSPTPTPIDTQWFGGTPELPMLEEIYDRTVHTKVIELK